MTSRGWCFALFAIWLLVGVWNAPAAASGGLSLAAEPTESVRVSSRHDDKPAQQVGQHPNTLDTEADEADEADDEDSADDRDDAEETPAPWYERLRFGGDFRSRYEGFYQDGRPTRNRGRMRLRFTLDTDINEDMRFRMRIGSGDPGTPVSLNQTFTSFFRPKPFHIDRAYGVYNPLAAPALTLGMGKFPTPMNRTQMTFDDDLNFEGIWEQVSWSPRPGVGIDLMAMQTAVDEASRGADSYMLAGYGAVSLDMGSHSLQVSAANYGWGNVDRIALAQLRDDLGSVLTNQLVRNGAGDVVGFASTFNVVDVIAEATFETSKRGYPLRVLAEYAKNTRAANERDRGAWVEAGYGDPEPAGSWGVTYTYGWVQQDLTPSGFVFSDVPGTNIRMSMIEASYVPKVGLSLDVTLHLTRRLVVPDGDPNNLLARLHVAAMVRF